MDLRQRLMQLLRVALQPRPPPLHRPRTPINAERVCVPVEDARYPSPMTDAPTPQPFVANARRRVPRWVWFVVACVALGAMTSVGVAWGIAWRWGPVTDLEYPFGSRASSLFSSYTSSASGYLRDPSQDLPAQPAASPKSDQGPLRITLDRLSRSGLSIIMLDPWSSDGAPFNQAVFDAIAADAATRRAIHRLPALLKGATPIVQSPIVTLTGWPCHCLAYEGTSVPDLVAWNESRARRVTATVESDLVVDLGIGPTPTHDTFSPAILVGNYVFPAFPLWPGLLANTAIYGGAWAVLIGGPILLRRWLRTRRGGCPQCGYSREGLKEGTPCPECGRVTLAAHDATTTAAAR